MKTLILSIALLALTACASAPLDQNVARIHAQRNCRVDAAVNRTYSVDSLGVGSKNIGYETCMRRAGFAVR